MSELKKEHALWVDRGMALGRLINKLSRLGASVVTRVRHINIVEPKTRVERYWFDAPHGTQSG